MTSVTAHTSWVPEKKINYIKIKTSLKREDETLTRGKSGIKSNSLNLPSHSNNFSIFRTAGPVVTAMLQKIGGTEGTCYDSLAPSTSRETLGLGGGQEPIRREVERSKEPPPNYS